MVHLFFQFYMLLNENKRFNKSIAKYKVSFSSLVGIKSLVTFAFIIHSICFAMSS